MRCQILVGLTLIAGGSGLTMRNLAHKAAEKPKELNFMCLGDSVTQGMGAVAYPSRLGNMLKQRTGTKYNVHNVGEAGSTMLKLQPGAGGCESSPNSGVKSYWNFKDRVFDYRPDIITMSFGLNDLQIHNCDERDPKMFEKQYEEDYVSMVEEFKTVSPWTKEHPDIYLMTPTPVTCGIHCPSPQLGERSNGRFISILSRVMNRTGVKGLIDIYGVFRQEDGNIDMSKFASKDGLHPDEATHWKIAEAVADRIAADAKEDNLKMAKELKQKSKKIVKQAADSDGTIKAKVVKHETESLALRLKTHVEMWPETEETVKRELLVDESALKVNKFRQLLNGKEQQQPESSWSTVCEELPGATMCQIW